MSKPGLVRRFRCDELRVDANTFQAASNLRPMFSPSPGNILDRLRNPTTVGE